MLFLVTIVSYRLRQSFLSKDQLQKSCWPSFFLNRLSRSSGIFLKKGIFLQSIPNEHSTLNRRQFDVDITSIRQRPNFDNFLRLFRVFFWCNFADRKIHAVSAYFFPCNFDGQKIQVVATYFFRCNFNGRKIHVVSTNFFRRNLDGKNKTFGKK